MKKTEIRNAKDNDLIVEYVISYSNLCVNFNLQMGVKKLSQHCADLEKELLARGLLTIDDVKRLNM